MTARYAIYYAPGPDEALHAMASAWLGRDAISGADLARPDVAALADLDLEALTADPRHYGFHATLKAPFSLADGTEEADLIDGFLDFAATSPAFSADIAVQGLSAFIAFRLTAPSPDMQALHEASVRAFEPFRAPLGEADLARRRKANLSPVQDERLVAYGYPYIFEDFRFHMTLTGAVRDETLRGRIVAALADHFAPVSGLHRFDRLSLFRQETRDADFRVLAQALLAG
jgi:putative phosphonate metabolism protein